MISDADQQCFQDEINDGRAWKHTLIGLELNPCNRIDPDGSVTKDEAFTERMMEYCRQQLGPQCVLENNSIRWPPLQGDIQKMYAKMRELGAPISFQTATPQRVGNLAATLQWALQQGAAAVELPSNYVTYNISAFDSAAAGLKANPP